MDMGVMGVSGRTPKMDGEEVWALKKWVKAPKFGKAVKFGGFCPFLECTPTSIFWALPLTPITSIPKMSVSTYFYTSSRGSRWTEPLALRA